jgi:hypothetical protein
MTDIDDRPVLLNGIPALTLMDIGLSECPLGHSIANRERLLVGPAGGVFCPECLDPDRRRKRLPGARECIHGHDITGEGAITTDNKCRQCRRSRAKVYKRRMQARGYHRPMPVRQWTRAESTIPARPTRSLDDVPTANGRRPRNEVARTPDYSQFKLPGQWRHQAACGPETAHLFDKKQMGEPTWEVEKRHTAARKICYGCPVFAWCDEWQSGEPEKSATVAALR